MTSHHFAYSLCVARWMLHALGRLATSSGLRSLYVLIEKFA
jgi:hypothetical protein